MKRRPLPQDLGIRARISELVGSGTGEMIGSHIADAVARGLDRMHLHTCQILENVGDVAKLRPVVLDVLPSGEMAIAAVILAGDMGKHPHLL